MTRPQTDPIAALRELAPSDMPWFKVTAGIGFPSFASERGDGPWWDADGISTDIGLPWSVPELSGTAIDMTTGTVHLRQPDGTIIEVTRKEWDV